MSIIKTLKRSPSIGFDEIPLKLVIIASEIISDPLSELNRKNYSCQHVLLRMIEMWRRCLDEDKVVGAILMDLSKAFDSLPHDLLIAKLHAYSFSHNALKLLLSYLSGRTQCVKNNNTFSLFKLIVSGVPQGSNLGPILFNVFYMLLSSNNLFNFADDNTILAFSETVEGLINILQTETEKSLDWMENNDMIVNPDKFDAIILTKDRRDNTGIEIQSQSQIYERAFPN